jgi:Mannosyl-glycoprotein endo-beta-N-acetylglucosaminidase
MAAKPFAPGSLTAALASALFVLTVNAAKAAPPIRTSDRNPVPACVTPERLMAFLAERNSHVDPRYREIARWYKYYGEGWRVRWDYAFFQMAIETNFLTYRRGDGRRGDVWETQNNFAGIGATGHGARGERFPDVKTGVHAQIQHLVAYSGERLAVPIAKRTRENQDDIVAQSNRLGRPVTFGDLARRWATDRAYGKSIDFVAGLYSAHYCDEPGRSAEELPPPAPLPMRREWRYPFRPPSGLGGPKPMELAGPEPDAAATPDAAPADGEVLPWLATPKTPTPPAKEEHPAAVVPKKPSLKSTKHSSKAPASAKSSTKVKTIWSRAGGGKTPPASSNAPTTAENSWGAATAVVRQGPTENGAAENTQAPEPSQQVAVAPPSAASAWSLPTFRIAPLGEEPSHLGGPLPADLGAAAKASQSAPAAPCKVLSASYGGTKTLLIRATSGGETQYTALTIIDGFEKSMFDAYARNEAVGAEIVGEYPTREAALADAKFNCPDN